MWAIDTCRLEVVQKLIQMGAEVNAKNWQGATPLHLATKNNSASVAELLIQNRAEVNAQDDQGETPLHKAILCKSAVVAEKLIHSGADINAPDRSGITPMQLAEAFGMTDLVELLKNGMEKKD